MEATTTTATSSRPNRVLVALAAAWMILSLAIGGVVSAGDTSEPTTSTSVTSPVQP